MCKLYEEVVYIKQIVKMYSIYLMHCTEKAWQCDKIMLLVIYLHLICVKCELGQ